MDEHKCPKCGAEMVEENGAWKCPHCDQPAPAPAPEPAPAEPAA